MVWAITLATFRPHLYIVRFATAFLELIEADHESFRTVHFQSCNPAVIAWHIRLESKSNDLRPFGVIDRRPDDNVIAVSMAP